MSHQTVEIGLWLGITLLALIRANLGLWHAHHVLGQSHQCTPVPEIRLLPSPVVVPALVPSAITQQASSALAS